MRKEFVMRGQTQSTAGLNTEILNFSGFKPGMAYKITEFQLYPSTNIGGADNEFTGSITAGKTAVDPTNPNFNDEGLIATCIMDHNRNSNYGPEILTVLNDTFLITQNLILMVSDAGGNAFPVNWQCRFEAVKMSGPEEAVTNYKQFAISDE